MKVNEHVILFNITLRETQIKGTVLHYTFTVGSSIKNIAHKICVKSPIACSMNGTLNFRSETHVCQFVKIKHYWYAYFAGYTTLMVGKNVIGGPPVMTKGVAMVYLLVMKDATLQFSIRYAE